MKRAGPCAAILAILVLLRAAASAHEGEELHRAAEARFEPPPAGSYELPPIASVSEHRLLDPSGQRVPLLGLAPGEVAFVSFVYLSCGEACPLATATLHRLDRELAEREDLSGRVQLVTVSFDPRRDTPEVMGQLARNLAPRGRWRFVTAADAEEIATVLSDFGQDAVWLRGPGGDWTGRLRHVLKVFLVDARGRIRNVYSTGFLDLRVLVNDAVTLLAK